MHHHDAGATLLVPTGEVACEGCREIVEAHLRTNPHVREIAIDARDRVARVQVDDPSIRVEELAELVARAYGERNPVPLPSPQVSTHEHAHGRHGAHDMSDP